MSDQGKNAYALTEKQRLLAIDAVAEVSFRTDREWAGCDAPAANRFSKEDEMLEEIEGSIFDENIVYVDRAALAAHNAEMARLQAEVASLRAQVAQRYEPIKVPIRHALNTDRFVTMYDDTIGIWDRGEEQHITLPDGYHLCHLVTALEA